MRALLYIYITLFAVVLFAGCDGSNHGKILAQTDSLLNTRPDSVIKLLDSIEKKQNLSEAELMHSVWNRALANQRLSLYFPAKG